MLRMKWFVEAQEFHVGNMGIVNLLGWMQAQLLRPKMIQQLNDIFVCRYRMNTTIQIFLYNGALMVYVSHKLTEIEGLKLDLRPHRSMMGSKTNIPVTYV
jgi:hypothetical protein